MKKTNKILPLLLVLLFTVASSVYASFPVKKDAKKEQTVNVKEQNLQKNSELFSTVAKETIVDSKAINFPKPDMDEKTILLLLWFFLGIFAAHRWYAKKPTGWNILFILTAGGCGVWAIIDLIHILQDNF